MAATVSSGPTTPRRGHFIFTDEHEALRESIRAFVQGARAARGGVGGDDVPRLGVPPHGRARLPRPLHPEATGVRAATTSATSCWPRSSSRLRRHGDGRRRPHRHGHAADPPFGTEEQSSATRARDRGREDLLPGDHRARRRLRLSRHQHPRRPRRRRVGHQRLEDVHHQRPPRRLHRARDQDRPGGRLRRLHPVHRRHGRAGRHPRADASRSSGCTPPTPRCSPSTTCACPPPRCSARRARASTTSCGSCRASG